MTSEEKLSSELTSSVSECQREQNGFCLKDDCKPDYLNQHGIATRAIHSGNKPSHWTHSPVVAPLYMTTTYETLDPGQADYEYSRGDNPTRTELQSHLAALESAKYGLVFSSGLGALTTAMFLLKSGQHVLCCDDLYGGTNRFFNHCANRMGIETTFVDGIKIENWLKEFRVGSTKMVWIETPTNPTMKIMDVKQIVQELKKLDPNVVVVIDNTFMTPVFQSPLKLGADIVMHSVTKYLNGHSDVIMGALMTSDDDLFERLKFMQNALGIIPSAFDCNQVLRSLKTLPVRVQHQAASAMEIAKYLEAHPKVEKVLYPGLKSHPQHELAKEQYSGFGGMLSFYLKPTKTMDESVKVIKAVKVFHAAVSLGCVCSLIEIPSFMTHSAVVEEERIKLGITKNFIRLSAGLENVKDLIHDLHQAIKVAYGE